MSLPGFLIIGAMKSGTTSLYRDLLTNPAVFLPMDKEPENLMHDHVLTEDGKCEYEKLFSKASPTHTCGEASTGYTKLPDYSGVPERAIKVLGSDLKIIYLIREPIKRIISHHYHEYSDGTVEKCIDDVVKKNPRFINWSRYAMQIKPWIETFSRENVKLIRFEDYINNRSKTIEVVCRFIGVSPRPDLFDAGAVHNKSEGKPVITDRWRIVRDNAIYRRLIRPLTSSTARERFRSLLLPKAPSRPEPPALETVEYLINELSDDMAQLQQIFNMNQPVWDMDNVRQKYATL